MRSDRTERPHGTPTDRHYHNATQIHLSAVTKASYLRFSDLGSRSVVSFGSWIPFS